MTDHELNLAFEDGKAARRAGKKTCPFALEPLSNQWHLGVAHESAKIKERARDLRNERRRRAYAVRRKRELASDGPRFVQTKNPKTGKWTRIDRHSGKVVGARKKRYVCPEVSIEP